MPIVSAPRRLYILCWSECSRRRLLPAVLPAAGHLTTPTVAGLPGLSENFRPTTSKSSPILRLLSSHWATTVVRTRVVGVANVGDSLRRLSSLQHRIYNLPDRHTFVPYWLLTYLLTYLNIGCWRRTSPCGDAITVISRRMPAAAAATAYRQPAP